MRGSITLQSLKVYCCCSVILVVEAPNETVFNLFPAKEELAFAGDDPHRARVAAAQAYDQLVAGPGEYGKGGRWPARSPRHSSVSRGLFVSGRGGRGLESGRST